MTPEEKRIYNKKYREENREYYKEYNEKNKEKLKKYDKEYKEKNKEKYKEQKKAYNQTEAGKKTRRISSWKKVGVKNDDFSSLYDRYLNCRFCEECNVELVEGMYGNNKKCLDHDHESGLFRNILCHICNLRRH